MQRKLSMFLAAGSMALACVAARAQMAVHALSGTVQSVTSSGIRLQIDPTTTMYFKLAPGARVSLDFDSSLRSAAVAASDFHQTGAFVVVYFYGFGSDVTAVAVKDLGAGPYAKVEGTVTDYDRRGHKISLKDASGAMHSFALADHLIVDSDLGADDGRKFSPHKGDNVRVTYGATGTPGTVSFIHERL